MAFKVICVDLWFDSSVEQQGETLPTSLSLFANQFFSAFCRVFRIGQIAETYVSRFVVNDTIDEILKNIQSLNFSFGVCFILRTLLIQLYSF